MHLGRVVWFNSERGFGLIETESGEKAFVHRSGIQESRLDGTGATSALREGQSVIFDLYEDQEKGFLARNVFPSLHSF